MTEHVVWKTPLMLMNGVQVIQLPIGAKALHVGMQGESVCVWWLVDRIAELEVRRMIIVRTGHLLRRDLGRDELTYVGTTEQSGFMRHVFEVKP